MKQSGESSYIELSGGELFKLLQLLSEEELLLPSLSRTEAIREWMAGHLGNGSASKRFRNILICPSAV